MKTLSDNLKVNFNVSSLSEGYYFYRVEVKSPMMATQIEFVGNAFITDSQSQLTIDLKDFAQNLKPKNNFLSLDDNGNVVSMSKELYPFTLNEDVEYPTRFRKAGIQKITTVFNNNSSVATMYIAGYDYLNKNLKPKSCEENSSDLCRLLQGTNWIVDTGEDTGFFKNGLLPRVPYKSTSKFGLGMELEIKHSSGTNPFCLSLKSGQGDGFDLGYTDFDGNGTMIALNLLYDVDIETGKAPIMPPINESGETILEDFPIYLKQTNSSGDLFGDYTEWSTEQYQVWYESSSLSDLYGKMYIMYKYNIPEASATRMVNREIPIRVYTTQSQAEAFESDLSTNYTYYPPDHEPMDCGYINSEEIHVEGSSYTQFEGTCPVAIAEYCPATYYLMWEDRYGDIMSQPFNGKNTYKESFTRVEIKHYDLSRDLSELSTQPHWTLNTGWISDKLYPYYESILVSPKVILYNTEMDKAWNVIVTNTDYTEKMYSNSNRLINFTVDLELDQVQYNIN